MGQARFVADDPIDTTESDLRQIVPQLHGVVEWAVQPSGLVTIEYDEKAISVDTIAEALAGLGFRVEVVADQPEAGDAEIPPPDTDIPWLKIDENEGL